MVGTPASGGSSPENTAPGQMSSHGLLAVLVVRDVFAPCHGVAFIVDVEHREVGHESVWGGTVPMLLARLEEHAVTWSYDLDRPGPGLDRVLGDLHGSLPGSGVRPHVPLPAQYSCWAGRNRISFTSTVITTTFPSMSLIIILTPACPAAFDRVRRCGTTKEERLVGLLLEDLTGDPDGRHCPWPAGIKREVDDHLGQLIF